MPNAPFNTAQKQQGGTICFVLCDQQLVCFQHPGARQDLLHELCVPFSCAQGPEVRTSFLVDPSNGNARIPRIELHAGDRVAIYGTDDLTEVYSCGVSQVHRNTCVFVCVHVCTFLGVHFMERKLHFLWLCFDPLSGCVEYVALLQ